jgi:hypothetical protein
MNEHVPADNRVLGLDTGDLSILSIGIVLLALLIWFV